MILGIDEVGRGPWAGPLVVGAVVLGGASIDGLTDSKLLTKKRLLALDALVRQQALSIGLGWVHADEIDRLGLAQALRRATIDAVSSITVPYHDIIIDGTINFLQDTHKGKYVTTMKKADLLIPAVSAASIVAKVARDTFMTEQDDIYEGYGFAQHVGYGTLAHRNAIEKQGITPIHRLSVKPLRQYAPLINSTSEKNDAVMTSKQIGHTSEDVASEYLTRIGHDIVDRNWKTRWCEIDIVSHYKNTLYFTEVKHRQDARHGGGVDAVTASKMKQVRFAAELYALSHRHGSMDLRLAVISTTGFPPTVETFLEVE